MSEKKTVLLLGKLPPPIMGPSVAFNILINSALKENYNLLHLDVKANETLDSLGKWSFKKVQVNFSIYRNLVNILKTQKPDLVLIPISQATLGFIKDSIFILLCFLCNSKVVIQLRGSNFKNWINASNFFVKNYVSLILRIPAGVIVLGKNLRYLFEDYFSPDKIYVVPNGSDYIIPEKQYSISNPARIIYLANLQPSKGIEDVVEALKILDTKLNGSYEMQIIGEWRNIETREKCMKIINENNLPVTFFNSSVSKNKFDYLLKNDIFVFTPKAPEGHPWVIVEAMAAGLPIISTNQGAISESVSDGVNGFIVESSNPQQIEEKLSLLIKDPALRNAMGKKSRDLYEKGFTEAKMVSNYTVAFNDLITE